MSASDERPLVIFTDATDLSIGAATDYLEAAGFDVALLNLRGSGEVPEFARRAVGAVVGYAHIGEKELSQLPRVRVLCTSSTGTDMIDLAAAARRGVETLGLTDVSTREVATHALALMLASVRELSSALRVTADGGWTEQFDRIPRATEELTLGLLGFGRIARATARMALPVFREVIAHDPFVTDAGSEVALVPFTELLDRSDVLSLHLPLTDASRRVLSRPEIERLRPGAVVVNVSRAELVEEQAILSALDSGALRAYAADVLGGEPPDRDDPLRRHDRAIVTPHIGFLSDRSLERYELRPAQNLLARLAELGIHGAMHTDKQHQEVTR